MVVKRLKIYITVCNCRLSRRGLILKPLMEVHGAPSPFRIRFHLFISQKDKIYKRRCIFQYKIKSVCLDSWKKVVCFSEHMSFSTPPRSDGHLLFFCALGVEISVEKVSVASH